jgi:choline dehydrogenase
MATNDRRSFLKLLGAGASAATARCAPEEPGAETFIDEVERQEYEYVVVGSGAGGGPLAANLARNGHRVLLLEAGKDNGSLLNYQVPAFHPLSTEDPAMRWDYFVKHYSDAAQQRRDTKVTAQGVLYPRAGTLGGCTAHHAMITVYPHASDWDGIAALTGDASWSAARMRRYFELLERCEYLTARDDTRGHGLRGWLRTRLSDASLAITDAKLLKIITASAIAFDLASLRDGDPIFLRSQLLQLLKRDLNNVDPRRDTTEGLYMVPSAIAGPRRAGPREFILETIAARAPLRLETNALATRVLFDGRDAMGRQRAVGVEYLVGEKLYRAAPGSPAAPTVTRKTVRATREVILACGAFNTPQLLKLSGVGARAELDRMGIPVKVDLPGVGTNLQDRYEVGVVSEVDTPFSSTQGCTFGASGDPCLAEWRAGRGVYTSNGVVSAVVKRSVGARPDPDLIIFGVPGDFRGYKPGYSRTATAQRRFTWAVLKAHTQNRGGTVTLRTKNPRDVPEINFKYFHEGTTANGADAEDMRSMVEGVRFTRSIGRQANSLMLFGSYREVWPGPQVASDTQVSDFVRNEAWGHHASCTCPMGPDGDPNAVLDSRFRVRGTSGLRVVDASIFPRIPGFFIVVPIYMASEKAVDVLLEDINETRRA